MIFTCHGVAFGETETHSNPNYLIILVHGINTTHRLFMGHGENESDVSNIPDDEKYPYGDLKGYLENTLGLKGYVYAYTFSERDGKIELMANELGNPSHDNKAATIGGTLHHDSVGKEIDYNATGIKTSSNEGNSWLEQAREDFKDWFKKYGPGKLENRYPTEAEIPKRYIIIAHSLGGLAARSYLASDYVQGDGVNSGVVSLITIDSQHLGSNGAAVLKEVSDYFSQEKDFVAMASMFGMSAMLRKLGRKDLAVYMDYTAVLSPIILRGIDENIIRGNLGWWPDQPGVQDVNPGSSFMSRLNSSPATTRSEAVKYRFIAGDGIPSPSNRTDLPNTLRAVPGYGTIQNLVSKSFWDDLPEDGKLVALVIALGTSVPWDENGDIYATRKSQRGEGLALKDLKTYEHKFDGTHSSELIASMIALDSALSWMWMQDITGFTETAFMWGMTAGIVGANYGTFVDIKDNYISGHGLILKKVYEDKIIDHALEDFITFGGNIDTTEVRSGISAGTVSNSNEGYMAPEQAFALLSNLDRNGNVTSVYHTVTIEAFTEGGGDQSQLFPIEINGQKKWVSSVSVTEYPTAFKGVINTFLPLKLKKFKYSENFAAWKNVQEVDEWGNFTVKDLHFAEGSNVLAFDAESWIGNRANMQFRVVCNTIPQFVGVPLPEPGQSTRDVYQKIGVEAHKACYASGTAENISVISFQVDGIEKLAEANIDMSRSTIEAHTRADWTPREPLSEDLHNVVVKFQSNVGVSQALWSFNVDTSAPAVLIGTLEAFAARAPGKKLNIPYSTSDNVSQFLKDISVRLYKGSQQITEITQIATQAAGEQFIIWDGKKTDGSFVDDGNYTVRITAFDQAGNCGAGDAQVKIDSTPPQIISAHIAPNPTIQATNEMDLSAQISERSTVTIKLINLSVNQTTAYLTQAFLAGDSGPATAAYAWQFDDPYTPGLRDGVYKIEVTAMDEAGNVSVPATLEGIRIDRTPPVIFAQYADPFVLANTGPDPYATTLRYQLSESNDIVDNRQSENNLDVRIKLYNENTGGLVASGNMDGKLSGENVYTWEATDPSLGKGAYKFQIVAYDKYGNYSTSYASCVKDGIAPAISFPDSGAEISGTVTIRGTAMDPDWTNDRPFKRYSIYYKRGGAVPTTTPGPEWQTDLLEVPEIYRNPESTERNVSIRPVQNDATLAYFYTGTLSNDVYTVLVIAEEEGGAKYASARTLTVNNDGLSGAGANPAVSLSLIPTEITFDGHNYLPINFTYGGKDINAYVEVLKDNAGGTHEAVYYKYFPKLTANFYSGQPSYEPGAELGYFVWQDGTGWHLRWNGEAGKEHRFSGSIVAAGGITDFNKIGDGATLISSIINWDRKMTGGQGGFDFKTNSEQLIIASSIDNDPTTYDDDYSSMVAPYFGLSRYQPAGIPVIINGISSKSDLAEKTVNWDGRIDSGAFVDSGDYTVRVRAEGADGSGLTVAERNIRINTPFEVTNVKLSSNSFDPLGLPDRVTVSYNISKDAHIWLKVFDAGTSTTTPLSVIDGGVQLGKTNPDFPQAVSWRGNYPNDEGTQVVTSGNYSLKLVAAPIDDLTHPIEADIAPAVTVDTGMGHNAALAQLDQIGKQVSYNGNTVWAAQGSSDYFWEALGTGTYYPPINYHYTLGIQGQQTASVYPYVPFAGILHRGFKKVFGLIRVTYKVYGNVWEHGVFGDLNPNPIYAGRDTTIIREYPFELLAGKNECIIPEIFNAGVIGWENVVASEAKIEFFSSGNTATRYKLDDLGINIVKVDTNARVYKDSCQSSKGMFNITMEGTSNDGCKNWRVALKISLADEIEYSRLTNRFVPWFGFINAKNSSVESFSNMNLYLTKLGFPGGDYFNKPSKPIETYKKEIAGSYDPLVYAFEADINEKGKLDRKKLEELTAPTIAPGDTSIGSQDAYLSDEYTEFIQITEPEQGGFHCPNSIKIGEETVNGTKRLVMHDRRKEYPITATTNYRVPYNDKTETSSLIPNIKWPNDNSDIARQNTIGTDRLGPLLERPQDYNISNTAYELDMQELNDRMNSYKASNSGVIVENGWFKKQLSSDNLFFDKSQLPAKYYKDLKPINLGLIIPKPGYVTTCTYKDFDKSPSDLSITHNSTDQNGNIIISAPASSYGRPWSTADDPVLRIYGGGVIRGGPETFNADGFSADGKSQTHRFWEAYRDNYLRRQSYTKEVLSYQYAFLVDGKNPGSGKVINNPDVVINDWQVALKDEADQVNQDLEIKPADIQDSSSSALDHSFRAKLKYQAKERRLIKLTGQVKSSYELMYFDGQKWIKFAEGKPTNRDFTAFWDVGRLCGKYTVLLKTAGAIDSRDIYIGDPVYYGSDDAENKRVTSAYKRAEVNFKPTSFSQDKFASVTPVTMSEIYIRNKPIIMSHGPILELKPSPYQFVASSESGDLRPHIRFVYTAKDLEEGYQIFTSPNDNWQNKTQDLWIHQVTANGDLQPIQHQYPMLLTDEAKNQYFAFEAVADHFSTYTMLKGKIHLSAPIVFADRYVTNKDKVAIYGSAEPESILNVYIKKDDAPPDKDKGDKAIAQMTAKAGTGDYRFEAVPLLDGDGVNHIYVTSHPPGNVSIETWSDVTVVKDTVPPSIESSQNLYAFSPNGDGKYDSVDYVVRSDEEGKIYFSVQSMSDGAQLFNQELSVEANREYKINWGQGSVKIYQPGLTANWGQIAEISLPSNYSDGDYLTTLYGIDKAGNISNNVINKMIVDTTPPTIIGINAGPNPFTPNDDGINDTTVFWCKFSEPAYVSLSILRDDGRPFRSHERPTENFVYPTLPTAYSILPTSTGNWQWDGRGSRNEMLGGTYTWSIKAEDWVGNITTSEVKQIVVDREPTLIPYAYAEPDPFSPVNPNNSFTEIIYYLARDNLNVSAAVIGEGEKSIKTLVNNEVQGKGEHSVRWYGDFNADYEGPTAQKNKYRVFDGSYEFQIKAVDPDAPNPAMVTNTVLVDNVAPAVTTRPVQVDYARKTASLTYILPENASVEVELLDLNDELIASLVTGEAKTAGEYTLTCSLEPVAPDTGQRYFRITAKDRAFNESEVKTEAFAAIPNQLQVVNHAAIPSTFTPNGDNHSDVTRITYNISGGVAPYMVSINILNPAGATTKRIVDNENQYSGNYSFYWDGTRDPQLTTKNYVADGCYEYQIVATDKLGTRVEGRGSLVVVATRPSVDLSASLPVFSPDGNGSKDTVTFNYSISYPTFYITGEALVKLEVLNTSGETVWSKIFNKTAGSYAYEWDGKVDGLLSMVNGLYYVRISAEDALGSTAIPKTINLQVDNTNPAVSILSVGPTPFSPNSDGIKDQVIISYSLSKRAYVSIAVLNSENQVVKNLLSNQLTEAYVPLQTSGVKALAVPTVVWDGTDDSGLMTADRIYTVTIVGTDDAGNSSQTLANIVLDNTKPAVPEVSTLPGHTNQGLQAIIGTSEPDALVNLYNNEQLIGSAVADSAGRFSIPANLLLGNNQIKATAADAAGNTSDFSIVQSVNYETDAPIILNLSVTPNPAKAGPVTISFEISEELKEIPLISINGSPATYTSEIGNKYTYAYNVTTFDQQGAATISIAAKDLANNLTTYQDNNLLTIDTVSPAKPVIYPIPAYTNVDDRIVSGEAEADSTVKIYKNGVFVSQVVAGSDGLFSQQIDLELGDNSIYVVSADPAGNQSEASDSQVIAFDTQNPVFSSVNVNPNPARAGPVTITFASSKTLEADPVVTVNGSPASYSSLNNLTYTYVYNVTESDGQGTAAVQIQGIDLAGNSGSKTSSFVIDTVYPVVSNVSASPNPAKAGPLTLKFTVSETLETDPIVKVNGNSAQKTAYSILPTAYSYEYAYTVTNSDQQGAATISIEAKDLANNLTTQQTNSLLAIDTVYPVISSIEVIPNLAKAGPVTISFEVSEELKEIPLISINGFPATHISELGNKYTYTYNVKTSDQQGPATILFATIDSANNLTTQQANNLLTIDTITPTISNVNIDVEGNPRGSGQTAYAKLGSKVKVDFSVSEALLSDPVVSVREKTATKESKIVYSSSRIDYSYSYTIAETDPDGTTPVSIEATDIAANVTCNTYNVLMVDKASPTIEDIMVSRNPANEGPIDIIFSVTDATSGLINNPTVEVTQNNYATFKYLTSLISGNTYRVTYTIPADSSYDGTASIVVKTTDKALNSSSASRTFEVDTRDPTFASVTSCVEGNSEFSKYAKEGSTVVISFEASEALRSNPAPVVTVNGNYADLESNSDNKYTFTYSVSPDDRNGQAGILINGYDLASNYGEYSTSLPSESFVIDTTIPTVEVGKNQVPPYDDLIAEPQVFSTNADPLGRHGEHLKTWLHYRLVEDSKVTLTIHKMSNSSQAPYGKEDFIDTNKVKMLINGLWQMKGQHDNASWEGRKDDGTYAEPGKYAFIVKAQDYAGNITSIKYGGTFWIQDNVLRLRPPDQLEYKNDGISVEANPDPLFISPFGNSTEPRQKRARLYFKIDLGITPKTIAPSEWIVAMGAEDDISWEANARKVVGTYQVKVYSEAGSLVWTSPTSEAESGRILWVDWGGTNEAGQQVPNGRYKMVVEVKDFRGQGVYENTLGDKWVTVDNEKPTVSNLSTGPYYFAPGPATNSSIKTTTLTYEVSDNSDKAKITVDVYKDSVFVKTLTGEVWRSNGTYSQEWDGSKSIGYVGSVNGDISLPDGVYTFKVSAFDEAGNSAETKEIGVVVDTIKPLARVPLALSPTSDATPSWTWEASSDVTSGVNGYNIKIGTSSGEGDILPAGWSGANSFTPALSLGEGYRYLSLRVEDNAGNLSDWKTGNYVLIDTSAPDTKVNPNPQYRNTLTFNVTWEGEDKGAVPVGIANYDIQSKSGSGGWTDWLLRTTATNANFTGEDGCTYNFHCRARDKVGNLEAYPSIPDATITVDVTPPIVSNATVIPKTFTPLGSGICETTNISFNVSESSSTTISIKDRYGQVYKITTIEGTSFIWNGRGNTGSIIPKRGKYEVYLKTKDRAGNESSVVFAGQIEVKGYDDIAVASWTGSSFSLEVYGDDGWENHVTNLSTLLLGSPVIRMGDFNGDGDDDIAAITWTGSDYSLDVYGDVWNRHITNMSSNPIIEMGDINGDAKVDIITLSSNNLVVYGDGWSRNIANVNAQSNIAIGDFNGDGKDDIVVPSSNGSVYQLMVYGYDWSQSVSSLSNCFGIKITDFNGDSKDDIAAIIWNGTDYSLNIYGDGWRRNGIGNVGASILFAPVLCAGDFNGDGKGDLAVRFWSGSYYSLDVYGDGWHRHLANVGTLLANSPIIEMGDFNGDGKDDIAVRSCDIVNYNLYIYGDGWKRFIAKVGALLTNKPIIKMGDFNGDGKDDVAVPCWNNSNYDLKVYGDDWNRLIANVGSILTPDPVIEMGVFNRYNVHGFSVNKITQSATFECPILISPEKDKQNVSNIRPTFEWKHHKGNVSEYNIDIAKNDTFGIAHQTFNKSANAGSPDKTDTNLYYFNYSIHEFDPGLDRDTYYWKVTALTTNEAATSEVWSFKIQPDLTLTGITNYPNPFSPNREKTKIRYRLSTDADDVKIRIYDITGSLVNELEGTTNGESANIWAKYNDIEWDGRNGRGDLVMNGIYPFEVTARLGDKSVSGRGKIAILK